jgi:23S rRNA (uracil1939-C5)-methyltransferase
VGELAAVSAGHSVLELYAGSGNFTRLWSGRAEVVAVDSHAAPEPMPGVTWRQEAAESAVEALNTAGHRVDVAVLDPPRTGAREVMNGLAELAPARIVYVSCDPATLGRDAAVLVAAGYQLTRVVPLDLMPQTAHVEVVAVFARAA